MQVTWIINTNMGQDSDIHEYVEAVKASGAKVIEVEYKPFSGELPDIQIDGPVVLYGATKFISTAYEAGLWTSGIFASPDTFTYENWAQHYGSMLLNSPDSTQLTTIGEFCSDSRDPEEYIFARPQHDTKSLVGSVWTAGKFKEWCEVAATGKYAEVNADTPIVIATPYGIEAEWRLFIVDNKVAGSSQYHKKGRLYKAPGAPQDVLEFAQKVIDTWTPAKAYTLDICRSAGNCYIVEAQGFNSAGQYASDVKTVASAVNEVAIQIWQESNKKNIGNKI